MPEQGPRAIVEERDACGVGFIVQKDGIASHDLVQKAAIALGCMEHRGGCSADRVSGDGAGIMTAIPWDLLEAWVAQEEEATFDRNRAAVGMAFLPQKELAAAKAKAAIANVLTDEGLELVAWRPVPTVPEILGRQALDNLPAIEQVIIEVPESKGWDGDLLEAELLRIRRRIGNAVVTMLGKDDNVVSGQSLGYYMCSLSARTIVYKGMVQSKVLAQFYKDLTNESYVSAFAVYHRRFSTNTMPKWPLAQPMRLLGHNGEINTLLGNLNWMLARQADLEHPEWGDKDLSLLKPVVSYENSDSANLDNTLELMVRSGRSLLEAVTLMVPEAYQNQPDLADHPEIVDYYDYCRGIQEPWDGPALLAFSDGKTVGAALDRNGLRPARYCITSDDFVIVGSEAGTVPVDESTIVEKGRLGPGQAIAVDLETNQILRNWDLKEQVARKHPYGQWLKEHQRVVDKPDFTEKLSLDEETLLKNQIAFGYTAEDLDMVISAMATQGKEPTYCMGDDAPLAVLSSKNHLLFDYFKQRFAQVTNPPIDPLRENLVMSLEMHLGRRLNPLKIQPEGARLIKLKSPVLSEAGLDQVRNSGMNTATLSTLYSTAGGPAGLEGAIATLCEQAAEAINNGAEVLILSDRAEDLSADKTYIPPLVAVGSVHHYLIRQGLRMKASLVADTAQCWSTHHFACMVGFGASAVCPYLTLESVRHWLASPKTQKLIKQERIPSLTPAEAQANYCKAVEAGLFKILSKMGISLLASYHGAQIFEAIGLDPSLVKLAFIGTTSRIGGMTPEDLARETMGFHAAAFPALTTKRLENMGFIQCRKGAEYHSNSPAMSKELHKAVRSFERQTKDDAVPQEAYNHYELYKNHLHEQPVATLRDLLDFKSDRPSINIDDVEPVEAILEKFCTGGMSLGALSPEAHEVLAIAMNRIGGKSNSGEGGEDSRRFKTLMDVEEDGTSPTAPHLKGLRNGDTSCSKIKQVASGRFGVTPEYLMSARQIEIKVAQGAKPGEGGQLPGRKVSDYIAMLRRSKPGVTLISPPPHHDIYSIEDLAQLIYDLHQISPKARVSVKLVSEIGIGTIAAGVAKANADVIQISGHDGGTGASPLSSIKHAGCPWELGLAEVHRTLMTNGLRDRVILRVDGGFKTGWDVLMGALMGAEEYGFGTIAMIAEGCIMARVCHMNSCPVGITSQQQRLRDRFPGIPGHVVNFFYFVAQEVRSLLAHLGYTRLKDIVGRADLLVRREGAELAKPGSMNLSVLTDLPDSKEDRSWLEHNPRPHSNGVVLDNALLADADIQNTIRDQGSVHKTVDIVNTDRSVGARISGNIAKRYGNTGFEGSVHLTFKGSAGQSFGAFNLMGMTLEVVGEANDYVGKGMNGGRIIIKPSPDAEFAAGDNVIVGNTCLYGATGGVLFANGRAGERFGVRNSKGQAVIEGAGDHCCEYMTGGVIVVLGLAGRNVGAGMTGGLSYFLDEEGNFPAKVNPEIVSLQRVVSEAGEAQLKGLIQAHADATNSQKAKDILANWETYLPKFWQVVPPSEAESPEAIAAEAEKVAVTV
ncbi:MAG: glutamate synthase-related protein [Cyanophyceae cyanobacterium]